MGGTSGGIPFVSRGPGAVVAWHAGACMILQSVHALEPTLFSWIHIHIRTCILAGY